MQFALTPFVLRQLTLAQFGIYVGIVALLSVGALVDFGIKAELTRRIAVARGSGDWQAVANAIGEGVGALTLIGGALFAIGVFTATWVVEAILGNVEGVVAMPTLLFTGFLAILCLGFAANGYFSAFVGLQRADVSQRAGLYSALARGLTTVGGLAIIASPWMLLLSTACSTLVLWIYLGVNFRRLNLPRIKVRFDRVNMFGFASVSMLLVVPQVSDVVDYTLDRVLISHYIGPAGAAEFSLGTQLPIAVRGFALIPLGVLLTAVAEMRDRQPLALAKLYEATSRLTLSFTALSVAAIVSLAPGFYDIYLGPEFSTTARAAQFLAVATMLNTISAAWSLWASGRAWYGVIAAAAGANALVNGLCSFTLIPIIGIDGALYGSLFANAVGSLVCLIGVRRADPSVAWVHPLRSGLAACLVFTTVASVVAWVSPPYGVAAILSLAIPGGLIGVALLVATKTIDPAWIRQRHGRDA